MRCPLCDNDVAREAMPLHVDNYHLQDAGKTIALMLVEIDRLKQELGKLVEIFEPRVQLGGEQTWMDKLPPK